MYTKVQLKVVGTMENIIYYRSINIVFSNYCSDHVTEDGH